MMAHELYKRSYRIFISYARADATELALRLRNDLSAAGHEVWLDLAEIAAGSSWARDIEEAIERCDLALTLLSHGSYASDICRGEQLRAQRKGKRVIPVMVQGDADRPLHLEHLNYLDFSNLVLYPVKLDDLLQYISTGQAPPSLEPLYETQEFETQTLPPRLPAADAQERKRDARAFKRYLSDLRDEPWLAERYWWTYFLFYFTDVQEVVGILKAQQLTPPAKNRRVSDRWDRMVRLYFRPRTPDLFGAEGIRPAAQQSLTHCPVPVYLLFDLEGVITLMDARFSEGDVTLTKRTFKAASAFRDLPFDLIYHDSWVPRQGKDVGERGEILSARRAQVILPEALSLTHLAHIMCRSVAERDTLLALLPDDLKAQWGQKIAVREDYKLFNQRWAYVEEATLSAEGAHFQFHPCQEADCDQFGISIEVQPGGAGQPQDDAWQKIDLGEIDTNNDLAIDLTELNLGGSYHLRFYLDEALAYAGRFGSAEDATDEAP